MVDTGPRQITHTRKTQCLVAAVILLELVVIGFALASYWSDQQPTRAELVASANRADLRQRHQGSDQAAPFNTDNLTIPSEHLLPGGPPKDGIPALTNPDRIPVRDATFLLDNNRVIGVSVNEESRAYPINVLNWHEVVNDELGGDDPVPIAVIYCPLCDSASVVDRRLEGRTYEFGVSGLLYNSNVVFYDRTDHALWTQVGTRALSGPNSGRTLAHLDGWELTTFADWRGRYPESTVMTFNTGHQRAYARTAYAMYFTDDRLRFPVTHTDRRFKNKEPVIGVVVGDIARVYPIAAIQQLPSGEVHDAIDGEPVHLVADARTGDVRVVQVPEGAQAIHTFWFAWVAFHPETEVYEPPPRSAGDGSN